MNKRDRTLIIIGGKEERSNNEVILSEVAQRIGSGKLVITTVAMPNETSELFEQYEKAFRSMGVKHIFKLEIKDREEATRESKVRILDDAQGVFFTGGDQVRITSQIGDTLIYNRVREIYDSGGVIAGTSAGAAVMSETMIVEGGDDESHVVGGSLRMAPGLGLIGGLIIDQHFMERGRVGRLVGAVAQNPKNLGIGIDERTAIVVEGGGSEFYVLGSGAAYVIDGSEVTYSNIAEEAIHKTLSIYDIRMHVLSQGDRFDLLNRRPNQLKGRAAEKLPEKPEEHKTKEQAA
jgi:cyanophycinase